MSRKPPQTAREPTDDFAAEHSTAGFTASLPITAGLESLGAIDGFDPDQVEVLPALQRRLESTPRAHPRPRRRRSH